MASSSSSFERHVTAPAARSASSSGSLRRGGQADDRDAGPLGAYPRRRLDAVEAGHAVVHEHDVRLALPYRGQRVVAVTDRSDHLDVGTQAQEQLERVAEHLVVLDEDDAHRAAHRLTLVGRHDLHRVILHSAASRSA